MTSLKDDLYVRKYVSKYQSDSLKDLAVLKNDSEIKWFWYFFGLETLTQAHGVMHHART